MIHRIPKIDTHQHLWDLRQFHLPWLAGGGPLATDHTMRDYLHAAEGMNIVQTVYIEVDVEPGQRPAEADMVIDLCQRDDNPMVGAVVGGQPGTDAFAGYVRRLKERPYRPYIQGVRQVLHGSLERGACLTTEFVRDMRILGDLGLRFDLCMRPDELLDGAQLADLCPDTLFILDHCGNANVREPNRAQWQRDIAEVARRSNVVCKISGIVASAEPGAWQAEELAPIIDHCADVFGKERILFGSDWPVCTLAATLRQWVEALQSIVHAWSEADQRKLFHNNAARVYNLPPAERLSS